MRMAMLGARVGRVTLESANRLSYEFCVCMLHPV